MFKIGDPQYWRRRAEEARTLTDELNDAGTKRKMIKIAEDYEALAIQAVQRLRQHSSNEGAAYGSQSYPRCAPPPRKLGCVLTNGRR